MSVSPTDVVRSAELGRATLLPAVAADWDTAVPDQARSCRELVDHIVSTSVTYALHLANEATGPLPKVRQHDPGAPVRALIDLIPAAAGILAGVARGARPGARGYHPAGMADAEGFCAMGCDELLVHTHDLAAGLGLAPFQPPRDLAARVLRRLFPWAPDDTEPWPTLLWANGRAALGDRARLDPDWGWHCAPLDEWDGTVASAGRA